MPKNETLIAEAESVLQAEAAELAQIDAEIDGERAEPAAVTQYLQAQASLRCQIDILSEHERLVLFHEAKVQEIRNTSSKIKAAVEARRTSVHRLLIFVTGVDEFGLARLMTYDKGTAALTWWGDGVSQRVAAAEDQLRAAKQRLEEASVMVDDIKGQISSLSRTEEVRDYLARRR